MLRSKNGLAQSLGDADRQAARDEKARGLARRLL
jgi:hypothetical protein